MAVVVVAMPKTVDFLCRHCHPRYYYILDIMMAFLKHGKGNSIISYEELKYPRSSLLKWWRDLFFKRFSKVECDNSYGHFHLLGQPRPLWGLLYYVLRELYRTVLKLKFKNNLFLFYPWVPGLFTYGHRTNLGRW